MQKKLLAFFLGMVPFCAVAETIIEVSPGDVYEMNSALNATNNSYVFTGGSGLNVHGGILVDNDFNVGVDAPTGLSDGYVYAETGIDNPYTVSASGNISIGQGLEIAEGYNLVLNGVGTSGVAFSAGNIEATGGLTFNNIGAVLVDQFVATGTGNVSINARSWQSDVFQMNNSKNVTLNLGTGIMNVTGNIENQASGQLSITAGNLTAAGIESGDNDGGIVLNLTGNLNLGVESSSVASLISKGNFEATVTGATTFAHGVDLSSMDTTNTFSLTTGTLALNERIDSFYMNNLSLFYLEVTNGDVDAGTNAIVNGSSNPDANMQLTGQNIIANSVLNNATLGLNTVGTLNIADNITNAAGTMDIVANTISVRNVNVNDGLVNITGTFSGLDELNVVGNLYQNTTNGMAAGSINFNGSNYNLTVDSVDVGGIIQTNSSDSFVLQTDNLVVDTNGISVHDFTVENIGATGTDITITGDVSGGLKLYGLGSMSIDGDYTFDDDSLLLAIINAESADYAYWATVTYDAETPLITNNSSSAEPMITVSGQVINNISTTLNAPTGAPLQPSQIGIVLTQTVDQGTAIWLMHADNGFTTEFAKLNISFCNNDGSICMDYLDAFDDLNGTDDDLPIYLATIGNDVYVVFDDRFADPIGLFRLQPVVGSARHHTKGEYQSAGALDDLIEARLDENGFAYDSSTPLIVVKDLFDGTALENVSNELYNRMHDYARRGDANVIKNFSRLFQLREANQITNDIAMNRYSEFREMSDMFIDEAIWNRNHRLNKLWIRGDYSMFSNDMENMRSKGRRFGIAFGYDWQSSNTLILGWTGHMSFTNNHGTDDINLGYGRHNSETGRVETDVDNTGFGAGGYFMKTLNNKARLYGDLMLDFNMIDVERSQTWVNDISGDAFTYGIMGELGLIHDWLNQYIIGNLYARTGYNFGFNMTEKVDDADYMKLKFDGHAVFTPGYSLTAQKRIYPSAWFEFRPYATVGVEYDLLGAPDTMRYKFALADSWTKYDTSIDPLWVSGGAGVEFLSVTGIHVGLGYRYTYNDAMQIHKLHLSAKYRF